MSTRQIKLAGVVPVIPVPFRHDESIDEISLRRAVGVVATMRLGGMVIPAYASEFYKLSDAERERVVGICIEQNRGRIPFIAQANHGAARAAAELARRYESMGADVISFAVPRQFATTRDDVMSYCGRIADAVSRVVMIQDFNPGGPTLDAATIAELHARHPNVRYVKLEEPLIADKIAAVREATGGGVDVIVGWGGTFMIESVAAGACGIMPGVPIADLLQRIFDYLTAGTRDQAYDLFGRVLPFISFALQNLELMHQLEKRLLVRRGVFETATVRAPGLTPSKRVEDHFEFLVGQILRLLGEQGFSVRMAPSEETRR